MSRTVVEAFAWALVHFVWQGAVIALAAGLLAAALRTAGPRARYAVYCIALLSMALAPLITFVTLREEGPVPAPRSWAVTVSSAPPAAASLEASPPAVRWLPWIVRGWLVGVAVLSLRSLGGWILAQRLKRSRTTPAAESFQRAAARLRDRLGMNRAVGILASAAADVPLAIGWLRPVVLLPVTALTALTPDQIEMLLAHELAHIRRHDYLVNLAQTALENALFYHPAVWWLSGRIRAEREHCCDDLAVAVCGDRLGYARALAALEGIAGRSPAFAVAADGGSLLGRIQRLLGRERRRRYAPPTWIVALLPVPAILAVAFSAAPPASAGPVEPDPPAREGGFLAGLADAGYTNISVDEIIALKEHGVEPGFVKAMLAAGLGPLDVSQLIRLNEHGVQPAFVAGLATSGLVSDLDVSSAVRLHEHGVDAADLADIRKLGFGPYTCDEVVSLRENGVTAARIRAMKQQGFGNLNLEQIVKLCRAGII
jgi:beta-lactamase regulating signal transducer with metallopeptidase domain